MLFLFIIILPSTKVIAARAGEIAGNVKAENRTPRQILRMLCWLERRRGAFLRGLIGISCEMVAWRRRGDHDRVGSEVFISGNPEHLPLRRYPMHMRKPKKKRDKRCNWLVSPAIHDSFNHRLVRWLVETESSSPRSPWSNNQDFAAHLYRSFRDLSPPFEAVPG
jgi:hypothetical protein